MKLISALFFLFKLDAKKSPLALLAQTCSQIGADTPNTKLLQSASEKSSKSNKHDSTKEKLSNTTESSISVHKSQFKAHDSSAPREKSRTPEERSSSASTGSRVRTPLNTKSNISCNNSGRCASNQSATSPRTSPAVSERKTPAVEGNVDRRSPEKSTNERNSPHTPTSSSASTKTAFTPNILTSSSDPAIKDLPLGTFKPGVPVSSAFLSGYPPPGFHLPMDLMASSIMSQHHAAALKSSGLSPYLAYGRLKQQESLQSVCRDPYCTGCSVSSHLLGAAKTTSCPAGCNQCDHSKPPTSTAYMSHSPAAAAYAHAQLAALAAASHLPYVCNWISGDASYCGKRFSNSEELLTHLRTHTSVVSVSEANTALSMLSSPGLPPTLPLLHRTYPTPPLSPLATARYHPYSKPSLLPPSLSSSPLSGFQLSHPSLNPYLSPYSLYGPRLGAAPGMHP